jgi:uncharacterized protein
MAVTLAQESPRQKGFYVPDFELRLNNTVLRAEMADITQVSYHDNIKEIDGFELTINNWDATTRGFKYVGSETPSSLAGGPFSARYSLFEPCRGPVEVWMGYLGDLRQMVSGRFTTLEPTFPNGGAPTLTVRGVNVLNELRTKQFTTSWTGKRDSEIARDIARLTDPATGRRRFNAETEIHPAFRAIETPVDYVAQENQYDIDFLLIRARQRGYVVTMLSNGNRPRLYFGPSTEVDTVAARAVTFQLDWGKSLMDFKPTMTTTNQVRSVTVHGWNRRTRRPIVERVSLDDARFKRFADLRRYLAMCNPREDVVVNEPVFTVEQARARAEAILFGAATEFVKATGRTVGLPDLRAGTNVVIGGIGSRFGGNYFITETTHTIGTSGYTTQFSARREEPGGVAAV